MEGRKSELAAPIFLGGAFIIFLSLLLYWSPPPVEKTLIYFENSAYDFLLRYFYKPVSKEVPIAIVDIDDKSLQEVGRWPWSRKTLGVVVSLLYEMGAKVVALDMIFPDLEKNLADRIQEEIKEKEKEKEKADALARELEKIRSKLDYDAFFAQELAKGESILGFVLKSQEGKEGALPEPLFTMTPFMEESFLIPDNKGYLSNLPILQDSAKGGGFINATPGRDGIIRYAPMLLRIGNLVYGSLSLIAAREFLGNPEIRIKSASYGKREVLEGIFLNDISIPTDPYGRSLIPFRGPPYSISHISAADILKGAVSREKIENRLIFIGSTATALGDLVSTAMAPVFSGVEIHAQIASGILDGYLPYKPAWSRGASIVCLLILGLLLALLLPFLGPVFATFLTLFFIGGLIVVDRLIWAKWKVVFPIVYPITSFLLLYVLNEVYGYVFEGRRRKEMRMVFGQYVPPERIDAMIHQKEDFGLEGETKELSVLFSDIRGFTHIAEGLSAKELKGLLNDYLTPMTEAIFTTKGTIDKYVGDLIMAFWGAPIEDAEHALHAVEAAFEMQKRLDLFNQKRIGEKALRVEAGIGINTGNMDVGDMGSKFRRAYTVLGDSVNFASRLEGLTKFYPVKILVGEKTYEATKGHFLYRLIDYVVVKGKKEGIKIYEPLGKKGELKGSIDERLKKHEEAFNAYFAQNWEKAISLFKELKEKDPNKKLYDFYLARIEEFKKTPPEEGWSGAYFFDAK